MRWYSYFVGYCIVRINCSHPERIINMALSRGIKLWDIHQVDENLLYLKVRVASYKALRYLGRRYKCKMKIVQKEGWPFVFGRIKKRKILVLGALFFCLSLNILGSFIWFVDIQGNEKISEERIMEEVAKFGVKPGTVKYGMNFKDIEELLLEKMPELAWVGIKERGTKITINVAEKVLIPPVDNRPAHLIARIDGTIQEILVLQGVPLVQEKQFVKRGQELVLGTIYPFSRINDDGTIEEYGSPQNIRAKAIIKAKVEHIVTAEWPLIEEGSVLSGKQDIKIALKFIDREIVLKGPKNPPYSLYIENKEIKKLPNWKNINIPVELCTTTYIEMKEFRKEWGPEGAFQKAQENAIEILQKEIPVGSEILNTKVRAIPAKNYKNIKAEVKIEVLEEITEPLLIK